MKYFIPGLLCLLLLSACSTNYIITDRNNRVVVSDDFTFKEGEEEISAVKGNIWFKASLGKIQNLVINQNHSISKKGIVYYAAHIDYFGSDLSNDSLIDSTGMILDSLKYFDLFIDISPVLVGTSPEGIFEIKVSHLSSLKAIVKEDDDEEEEEEEEEGEEGENGDGEEGEEAKEEK